MDGWTSDARAVMERNIQRNADGSAESESGKVYKGQAGYKNYITKNEAQIGMNKYTGYVVIELPLHYCIAQYDIVL